MTLIGISRRESSISATRHVNRSACVALLFIAAIANAADGQGAPYAGRRVIDVIEEFREADINFVYSTYLITPDLHVAFEPENGTPLEVMREILGPHGLTVKDQGGAYVIVRDTPQKSSQDSAVPARVQPEAPGIETVVVAASRYEISREIAASRFRLDRRTIQNMPDVGEDPIRVVQRLPGAAASGASAKTHFRGGEENEVGIMLNGQWLFDPFHIRDYQNVFSTIDARAIDGVEVYTGGFPVRYGDRMSGMVLMNSLDAEESRHHEIGLSVFNTSLLTTGSEGGRKWLLSARRGNLDLVIDPKFGQPSYYDVFGEYALELSPNVRLSVNALYADDQVELILETDPAEREQVVSDTRNAQAWLRLDSNWSPSLASSTVLSFLDYSNRRAGETNDAEKMVATVSDNREVRRVGMRQDWVWRPSEDHLMQWGLEVAWSSADYAYRGSAEYYGLQALFGQPPIDRLLEANPEGGSYAVYVADRWKLSPRAVLEWGLRWDDQTYTDLTSDSQLSPRVSAMYRLRDNTEVRVSAGRYHQSQSIQSLQIEDGVTQFWPAQRADHVIVGVRRMFGNDVSLRAEAFVKEIRKPRPRFENLYDPLGVLPELQADRVRLDPSLAQARGIELSVDWAAGAWDWWATYTWSRVVDRIEARDEPRSWDQRHAFQLGLGWHDENWSFSTAFSVRTGWPATGLSLVQTGVDSDGDPDYRAVPGPRNAERLPTFSSLDLRLSRRFNVRRGTLLAFVEVSNAANRRNVCCIDWDLTDEPDGSLALEQSRDYWMPLLPAIGILWEF